MGIFETLIERLERLEAQNNVLLRQNEEMKRLISPPAEEYLSIEQTAALLNVTKATLYNKRYIPHRKVAGKLMYKRSDIINYIETSK